MGTQVITGLLTQEADIFHGLPDRHCFCFKRIFALFPTKSLSCNMGISKLDWLTHTRFTIDYIRDYTHVSSRTYTTIRHSSWLFVKAKKHVLLKWEDNSAPKMRKVRTLLLFSCRVRCYQNLSDTRSSIKIFSLMYRKTAVMLYFMFKCFNVYLRVHVWFIELITLQQHYSLHTWNAKNLGEKGWMPTFCALRQTFLLVPFQNM